MKLKSANTIQKSIQSQLEIKNIKRMLVNLVPIEIIKRVNLNPTIQKIKTNICPKNSSPFLLVRKLNPIKEMLKQRKSMMLKVQKERKEETIIKRM